VIDSYSATLPAKFFAMVIKNIFKKLQQLLHQHPKLYEQFKKCYLFEPKQWFSDKFIE
jgi:Mlc titration factor MtfA (ptsG expression regulator)